MPDLSLKKSTFRRPTRRQLAFFLVLLFVFSTPAALNVPIVAPIDWMLRGITAGINERPYEGDGVAILVDDETINSLEGEDWSRTDLAALISIINEAGPRQVVIGEQLFAGEDGQGSTDLRSALQDSDFELFWQVNMTTSEKVEVAFSEVEPARVIYDASSPKVDSAAQGLATPTAMAYRPVQYFATIRSWYAYTTSQFKLPSSAQVLAQSEAPGANEYEIDVSYRADTIPTISAGEILQRKFDLTKLAKKQIVVGRWGDLERDSIRYRSGTFLAKAEATLIAAQSLKEGPPRQLGSWPAIIIACLGCLAWLVFVRPIGRWIALSALFSLLASLVLLERLLIFQTPALGLLFFLTFGLGKVWMRNRRAAQTYRDAAESKSRFLSQASHDLRQPIHAIGLLAARLAQTDLSPSQAALVSQINWSVDNASRMFRTLLDIAAIESGTLKRNIEAFPVNEIFSDIDSQNSLVAEQNQVELRLVPSEAIIKTDRVLLTTMVQNLVSNSIKYSPGEAVVVGCRRSKNSIRIEVVDSGRGISAADLKHVKDEFYRSSDKSRLLTDSKGLGLAIVNQLAGMLDLGFELTSVEGKGTRAAIGAIPMSDGLPAHDTGRDQQILPLSGLKVTFVEDDEETLLATEKLLEQWGCDVTSYTQFPGEDLKCDVFLSDFDFGPGGLLSDHVDELRARKAKGARVIVVSGRDPESIRDALSDMPDLVLSKPVRPAELRSALMASLIRD